MTAMEPEDLRAASKRLRSAEPSRTIRGFDQEQTRDLLHAAAELLSRAADQHEAMGRELEELHARAGDEAAGKEAIGNALIAATQAGEEIATDARATAERITAEAELRAAAILEQATTAAGEREQESIAARERIGVELAAARAAAEEENAAQQIELERLRERLERDQEALQETLEHEREAVLDEAKMSANALLTEARHEVEQLERYGERLRSLLNDSQRRFVELAESALHQLDAVEESSGSGRGDLLDDLRPAGGEPARSTAASEATGE